MSLSWQTVAEVSNAQLKGIPFQFRQKDDSCWFDSGVQTLSMLYTLSNCDIRVRPTSIPEAEKLENEGHFLYAEGEFRRNGFEEDARQCNAKDRAKWT